jgi:hypothetical protein
MTPARPPRLGRRDLVIALVAFWAITSLVFTVGRWFMPNFSVPGVSDRLGPAATDAELRRARIFDLQTALAGPPPSSGVADVSGALQGRLTFEHLDELHLTPFGPEGPEGVAWECVMGAGGVADPECHYHIKIRLRSDDGVVLLITGNGLVPDAEATTGFSMTVSAPGLTFNSKAGQCTLGLTVTDLYTPRVAGWAMCTGLTELRSGVTLDLLAAFDAVLESRF